MATTDTKASSDNLVTARREESGATVRLLSGVAVSITGIALVLLVFLLFLSRGATPTIGQGVGTLLLAVVAFAISAWGTDVRHAATKRRKALRVRIGCLEAARAQSADL